MIIVKYNCIINNITTPTLKIRLAIGVQVM